MKEYVKSLKEPQASEVLVESKCFGKRKVVFRVLSDIFHQF